MAQRKFIQNPQLTNIALMTKNEAGIADELLPRTAPMKRKEFKYVQYDETSQFTIPDTKVGRKSQVNKVEMGGTNATGSCEDYGLEYDIPVDEEEVFETASHEQLGTELITGLIHLDREVNVAKMLSAPAAYGGNVEILSSADALNNNEANVIQLIREAQHSTTLKSNIAMMSQDVWLPLSVHPHIVAAIHGNSGTHGVVTVEQFAAIFGFNKVLVGESKVNVAKPGQDMDLKKAWNNIFATYHVNRVAAKGKTSATFGFTAQFKDWYAGRNVDSDMGLRGGTVIKVGESRKEVICQPRMGYLLQNPLGL